MKILYFGELNKATTSYHRAKALERIGHSVRIFNPLANFEDQLRHPVYGKIHFHTGYRLLQQNIRRWLTTILAESPTADLIWINGGEFFGKSCLRIIKELNKPILLYNNDDPTGKRDGRRFDMLIQSLPFYDVCAAMREVNVDEYLDKGVKKVVRITMSYDEVAHHPLVARDQISKEFTSDIAFLGTWMRHEQRDKFLMQLIKKGLPLSIWGERWPKSPDWNILKKHYRGGALAGTDYVHAIQGSRICLGLLSKGNRDLHTTRSFEIPFSGGVLCAERTAEHSALYKENEEAVFWSDSDECSRACAKMLSDEQYCENIRVAGMRKVRMLHAGNEDVCKKLISEIS